MPIAVTAAVPQAESTDSVSPDGFIRATVLPASAGVFIRVDFSSVVTNPAYHWPNPFYITIWREEVDGTQSVVRGAQGVAQYGGIAHAYDDEVRFGQIVSYWAVAEQTTGIDVVTNRVQVLTWEPDGGFTSPGVWIKNLEDPDLSVPVRCLDWSAGSYASRNAAADVWGGRDPAVVTDVRKSYSTSLTALTADEDEYQGFLSAVGGSVVYIVGLERHRRRTGYYLVGDIAPARIGKADSVYDAWTVALTSLGRPSAAGWSLVVPGRSYADRQRAHGTYQGVKDAPPNDGLTIYNSVMNPSLEVDLTNTQTYQSANVSRLRVTTDFKYGIACVQHTHIATGNGGTSWTISPSVTGQKVQAGVWVKVPAGVTSVNLVWRSGTTLLSSQTVTLPVANVWTRVTGSYQVGAAEVCDRIGVAATAPNTTVWYADAAMAQVGNTIYDYGDGSSGGGWIWDGTANASSSHRARTYGAGVEPY